MGDVHARPSPAPKTKSRSTGQDNVFLVQDTNIDLATLFSNIDKKPAEQEESTPSPSFSSPKVQPPEANEVSAPVEEKAAPNKALRKRVAVIGTLMSLGIMAAGAALVPRILEQAPPQPVPKNSAVVRQAIAVPKAVEHLEVFFMAQSKEKAELLCMNLAVHANRPNAEAILSELGVAVRDAVYNFLSQQRPEKNVRRFWSPIVEKKLLAELQQRFPQAGIVTVELEDIQRI
ncbi:hypothetical protein [Desulfosoma caldarium]|uniref:Flagellar protein FliL n=1 Tax=Desulfosoma caldarium TaxID=610254 RepID=A0A3N1VNT9_9BACT|nr:hypothetical protein [Desulfosoma caldarium]ROR01892.1 hypothetical protein EDC27_1086 [Desulfosoma caldarium]